MAGRPTDDEDPPTTPGALIRFHRKALGYEQEALARELGVSLASVNNWENDRNVPQGRNLVAISDLLGLTTTELLGGAPRGNDQLDRIEALLAEVLARLDALQRVSVVLGDEHHPVILDAGARSTLLASLERIAADGLAREGSTPAEGAAGKRPGPEANPGPRAPR